MKLRDQFTKNGYYHSILDKEKTLAEDELCLEYLYDEETEPREELYDIYLSKYRDELFLVLKMEDMDPSGICEWWDRKISLFTSFGSQKREILNGFKYNVIQLLLYQGVEKTVNGKKKITLPATLDRSEEGSVSISRKIILPYINDEDGDLEIPDEEAVEIPFYLIPVGDALLDEFVKRKLNESLPKPGEADILYSEVKKQRDTRTTKNVMSFGDDAFNRIKEWLISQLPTTD